MYSVGTIAEKAQSVVLLPVYTLHLSPEDFGILSLLALLADIVGKAIIAPLTSGLVRFYHRPDWQEKSGLLVFNMFLFLLFQCVIASGLAWNFSGWIAENFLENSELWMLVQLYSAVFILRPTVQFLISLVRLREMAKFYVIANLSALIISVFLNLYFLLVLERGVVSLVYGELLYLALMFTACLPVWAKNSTFRLCSSVLRDPLKFGYPQILSGYSNLLIQSGDRYLLLMFLSTSAVGIYSLGYKVASLVNFLIVGPLKQALFPIVLKNENDPVVQKDFLNYTAKLYYLIALFVCLFVSIFSFEIVKLLVSDQAFWSCWVIVPVIAFSYVQHGLGQFVGWGVIMKNKGHIISISIMISSLVNIGLNFLFIPVWGIGGAAAATLISYIVWNGLKVYFSAALYDLYFDLRHMVISTLIAGLVLFLSLSLANSQLWYINILIKMFMLFSFPCVIWFIGLIGSEEKIAIKTFFRRSRRTT